MPIDRIIGHAAVSLPRRLNRLQLVPVRKTWIGDQAIWNGAGKTPPGSPIIANFFGPFVDRFRCRGSLVCLAGFRLPVGESSSDGNQIKLLNNIRYRYPSNVNISGTH